jgi:hypothetical protein
MAEHFFMWFFLAIWTSSFEKALFNSFAHFFIGSLIPWEFSFWFLFGFFGFCCCCLEALEHELGLHACLAGAVAA